MATTNLIRKTYLASATGAQDPFMIDWRDDVPSGYTYEVQFDGAAAGSVTIESTLDDINNASITPIWIAETAALTADARGVIGHPVVAIRLNIGSLAGGTLTFKAVGGSVIGDSSGSLAPGGGGGVSSNVNLSMVGGTAVVTGGIPGLLAVGGNVANGVADTGNPMKIGGVYSDTIAAAATGQRVDASYSRRGSASMLPTLVTATAADAKGNTQTGWPTSSIDPVDEAGALLLPVVGTYLFNGTAWDRQRMNAAASGGAALVELGPYVFGRVTADGQIKGSAGLIHTITISPNGSVVAGVLTIYNSLTETGTIVAQFSLPVTTFTPFSVTLDVACGTGIFVGFDATLTNVSCTVSYR